MTDTRPFNLEHAKAGAPYACRDGREATVLKWDCRDEKYLLAGVCGRKDDSNEWLADGRNNDLSHFEGDDLVMTPLGYIDGKPVFVGDLLVSQYGGFIVPADPACRNFDGMRFASDKAGDYRQRLDSMGIADDVRDQQIESLRAKVKRLEDRNAELLADRVERERAIANAAMSATFDAFNEAWTRLGVKMPSADSVICGVKP